MIYDIELQKYNITLLEVFKWFFTEYLLEEFGVSNFDFSPPTEGTSYYEKVCTLSAQLDLVLKQFNIYTSEGFIDHELLEISSNHLLFKEVFTMIQNKYIYPCGDIFEKVTHYLFSDQSMIFCNAKLDEKYSTFYDLIIDEDIEKKDISYGAEILEWLIEHNFVNINRFGFIKIVPEKVLILRDLYINRVTCTKYLNKLMPTILQMIDDGLIVFGESLFSKPEQDYLNYILNRSQYSNGLDLRNRYLHGTHPRPSEEHLHRNNYYILLKIFALTAIKINEEFCLKEKDGKS